MPTIAALLRGPERFIRMLFVSQGTDNRSKDRFWRGDFHSPCRM
jgi:hypothetical protein